MQATCLRVHVFVTRPKSLSGSLSGSQGHVRKACWCAILHELTNKCTAHTIPAWLRRPSRMRLAAHECCSLNGGMAGQPMTSSLVIVCLTSGGGFCNPWLPPPITKHNEQAGSHKLLSRSALQACNARCPACGAATVARREWLTHRIIGWLDLLYNSRPDRTPRLPLIGRCHKT